MKKTEFYRQIEQGELQGANRYREYWFVYKNIETGERVLELGGGHTRLSWIIMQKGCEVHVTEIDQGPYMHHHNLAKLSNKYNAIKVKDEKIPSEDNYFDVIFSASSIEHFDPDNNGDIKSINEVYKKIKKNGKFIVTIPTSTFYIPNRYSGHPIHPPEKVYDSKEFKDRFLKKFELISIEFWRWSSKMPKLFEPHKSWIKRVNIVNTELANSFEESNGLCTVLKPIK